MRLLLAAVVALMMLSADADADMRRFVGRILWLSGSELILAQPNAPVSGSILPGSHKWSTAA